jgi:hypothetical protein
MRNTARSLTAVAAAVVVGIACSGSSVGAGSLPLSSLAPNTPLPVVAAADGKARPVLLWKVISSDGRRLVVAVRSGTPAGVAITEDQQAVTVLVLGRPEDSGALRTLPLRTTVAVVELPHALDGRQLVGPSEQ